MDHGPQKEKKIIGSLVRTTKFNWPHHHKLCLLCFFYEQAGERPAGEGNGQVTLNLRFQAAKTGSRESYRMVSMGLWCLFWWQDLGTMPVSCAKSSQPTCTSPALTLNRQHAVKVLLRPWLLQDPHITLLTAREWEVLSSWLLSAPIPIREANLFTTSGSLVNPRRHSSLYLSATNTELIYRFA